ncbi:MAG: hypothetical protein ACLGHY_13030 [Gammaproteobacteria bacterium]
MEDPKLTDAEVAKFTAAPAAADTLVLKPGNLILGNDGVTLHVVSFAPGRADRALVRADDGEHAWLPLEFVYHDAERGYCARIDFGQLPREGALTEDELVYAPDELVHEPPSLVGAFDNRERAISARGELLSAGFVERQVTLRAIAPGEAHPLAAAWSEALHVQYLVTVQAEGEERTRFAGDILESCGGHVAFPGS